jgi:hypothetical protein
MAYSTADGQQQLLDSLAEATEQIAVALAALGAAYEALDERSGDELEETLFRPVQLAFGRARRTHSEFAGRHGLATRTFEQPGAGHPSTGAKGFIANAVDAVARADDTLGTLQDSMLPVEVGDRELRTDLAEVRTLVEALQGRAHQFVRMFGR